MKLLTIIGSRQQFVKAATVSRAVARCDDISESIVHTGQHYDASMSDIFLRRCIFRNFSIISGLAEAVTER